MKSSHTFAEPSFQALSLTCSASADYKHHCERSIFCVSGMSLITFETHQSEEQHDSGPIIVLTRKLQMKFGRIMWSGVLCPRLATFYVLGSYPLLPITFYTCTHRLNTLQSTVWLDYNILRTGKPDIDPAIAASWLPAETEQWDSPTALIPTPRPAPHQKCSQFWHIDGAFSLLNLCISIFEY